MEGEKQMTLDIKCPDCGKVIAKIKGKKLFNKINTAIVKCTSCDKHYAIEGGKK